MPSNQRAIVVDLNFEPQTAMRPEFGVGVSDLRAHRSEHPDVAPGCGEPNHAGLLDGLDELCGAAVHRRHLRTVDLDHDVVDLQRPKRRHQMLDRRD